MALALAASACNGGYYVPPGDGAGEPVEPDPATEGGAPGVPTDDDGGAADGGDGDDNGDDGVKFDIDVMPAPAIPHEIVVYRGQASGAFGPTPSARYAIGEDVRALAPLPSSNGDDLLVAGASAGGPELRRFTDPANDDVFADTLAERFTALGVGDVDGDGDADVVLADERWVWSYAAGASTLAPAAKRKLPDDQADARAVAVADLAGDGVPDVLVAAGWQVEGCGGRPLSLAVIDDFSTAEHSTTQTEYGGVAGGGLAAQLALARLDGDATLDVLLAADFGDVLEFRGAGSVFDKPRVLAASIERVALRPRPTHASFDMASYDSPSLSVWRIEATGLVDVASNTAFATPARLALFDARPSVAVLTEPRDRVVILDLDGSTLVEADTVLPIVAGDDVIFDVVIADFDGDGFEDLALDVASASALNAVEPGDPFGGGCASP